MTKLIYTRTERCRPVRGKFCVADVKLPMRIVLFNVRGEQSHSVVLMWKENVDPTTLIGIDRIAGVRMC